MFHSGEKHTDTDRIVREQRNEQRTEQRAGRLVRFHLEELEKRSAPSDTVHWGID